MERKFLAYFREKNMDYKWVILLKLDCFKMLEIIW